MGANVAKWETLFPALPMSQANQPIYTSRHRHSLDDKNRITIPSAWRYAHDADDVFLAVPQSGGYVAVLPPAEAAKLRAKIEAVALSDEAGQDFIATFFSKTQQVWFDKAGRIALNDDLRAHAGIKDAGEAILVGGLTKFNVYSPERWAETQTRAAKDNGDAMRRLGI